MKEILILNYVLVGLYSWIASSLSGCYFHTIFLYYFLGLFAFYLWHVISHQEWSGEMYKQHMRHHIKDYPPKHFYGRPGLKSLKPNEIFDLTKTTIGDFQHEGLLFFFVFVIILTGKYIGSSNLTLLFVTIGYYIMAVIGNAFHASFHIKNFPLEKYKWYRKLRRLHFIHHLENMDKNFAMVNFGVDALFGTYKN